MSKLDNFIPTNGVNNKTDFLSIDDTDEIIRGASCTHVFRLPFSFNNVAVYGLSKIIYKQRLEVILVKDITEDMVFTMGDKTVVKVELSPLDTLRFYDTVMDAFCQVRICTKNNKILYDEAHKIKVITPLETEVVPPNND